MRRKITSTGGVRALTFLVAAGLSLTTGIPGYAYVRPTVIERVSITPGGPQGNDHSTTAAITPNGRYTAFISYASNLVPGDTNKIADAFLRDNRSGEIKRVSIANDGTQAEDPAGRCGVSDSFGIDLSANGRYITFTSNSCDKLLPQGFVNAIPTTDVFVHDTKSGRTELISKAPDGTEANSSSVNPTISASGRFVAFESRATNLDPKACGSDGIEGITCEAVRLTGGGAWQIYVYDRVKERTKVVSVSSDGDIANGESTDASISPDGRHIAFTSAADNLVPNDDNQCHSPSRVGGVPSCQDVFFHDTSTGETELISIDLDGNSGDWQSGGEYRRETISADNRYVLFWSAAKDLVPNSSSAGAYVRDRKTGRTEKISVDSAGRSTPSPGGGSGLYEGNLTPDGRHATFQESLVETHCGTISGFGLHDRRTGATEMYPRPLEGSACPSTSTHGGNQSANGRFVVFDSWRPDIVESDTNEKKDIFLLDRGVPTGVGALVSSGRLSLVGTSRFRKKGFASFPDTVDDLPDALTEQGANLYGASLAYRRQNSDLFVTIELEHMPKVIPGASSVLYGMRFEAEDRDYEVRASSLNYGTFGLFDCTDPLACTKVADLEGGYGTTGMRVVFSLPLEKIGLEDGGKLKGAEAFSGFGSYITGAAKILDHVKLK